MQVVTGGPPRRGKGRSPAASRRRGREERRGGGGGGGGGDDVGGRLPPPLQRPAPQAAGLQGDEALDQDLGERGLERRDGENLEDDAERDQRQQHAEPREPEPMIEEPQE